MKLTNIANTADVEKDRTVVPRFALVLSFLSAERKQLRLGSQIHDATGDGGGGVAQLAQRHAGQEFELVRRSEHTDTAVLRDAIQPATDPDGRAVERSPDSLAPHDFSGCDFEARDDPVVRPEIQAAAPDPRR